jgi:hypothetical protein
MADAHPQAGELRPAEKCFSLWLEYFAKLADKVDPVDFCHRNWLLRTLGSQQLHRGVVFQQSGVEVAPEDLTVAQANNGLLQGRSWAASFHKVMPGRDLLPSRKNYAILFAKLVSSAFVCLI